MDGGSCYTNQCVQYMPAEITVIAKLRFSGECLPGTPEAFRARMEAQCREIERYREKVMQEEGRDLDLEDAAREWIDNEAEDFDP